MIKNIGKSILFVLILGLLLILASYVLLPWKVVVKYGIMDTAKYPILSEDENTIDAVAIGDSLIYSSVSPMEIYHNYGYTVFDCANSSQIIEEAYANMEMAAKSQHPKVVFFDADVLFRDRSSIKWYYYVANNLDKYVPMINYHDNWKKSLFNFLNTDSTFTKVNINKGYKYISKVKAPSKKKYNYMKKTAEVMEIPEKNLEYFAKMVNLANTNDIKFVLISIPDLKKWNYPKHNAITKLASQYNLEFIDLNVANPLKINWKTDTKDKGGHLNYKGALKVSNFLGKYLQDTKLVVDHRQDKKYRVWDESYVVYKENLK